MRTAPTSVLVLALALGGCRASSNPSRPKEPAPWTLKLQHVDEPTPTGAAGGPRAEPAAGAPGAGDASAAQEPAAAQAAPAAAQAAAAGPQAAPAPGAPLVVATVSGRPIDAAELLARLHAAGPGVQDELVQLVMERMVELESARHGVVVEPEDVERAYQNAVTSVTREIARNRPGTTLDEYVRRGLGLDPENYRARLRVRAQQALLGERVFRMHLLTHEHAWARMITVATEAEAETIRGELERGGDFAALARSHGGGDEEEQRGRLEPVLKGDNLISRLVFQAEVGEVVGPTLERGSYVLLLVEERPAPLTGRWPDVRDAVERSLTERPVQDLEIRQWQDAVERRYEIDLAPFLRLVGELPAER